MPRNNMSYWDAVADAFGSIVWMIGCFASATCAGVLCGVLWERFANLPALLALWDVSNDYTKFQSVPNIAVCQQPEAIAEQFLRELSTNDTDITRLSGTFANAVRGLPTNDSQVDYLDHLFNIHHVSLLQVLYKYTPDCGALIKKCSWQGISIPCEQFFRKDYTREGVCCVSDSARLLTLPIPPILRLDASKKIVMVLGCTSTTIAQGCEFFTKYEGEEWILLRNLKPGFNYMAHLTFNVEEDNDADNLIGGLCIASKKYSERKCWLTCIEKLCGCSNPLKFINENVDRENYLPPCRLKKISCLRTVNLNGNSACNCLPSCKKVIAKMVLDANPITDTRIAIDPVYSGLNTSETIIVRLKVDVRDSKIFSLVPTETWLTLLSSLGGVFNMFLGVGVFSALEFLFFLLVKLPAALRHK